MFKLFLLIFKSPIVAIELLTSSAFLNFFSLSSSIFVILVLNRYVTYGLDGTLITLTIGVIIAVLLEFVLRRLRFRFSQKAVFDEKSKYSKLVFSKLISMQERVLISLHKSTKRKIIYDADRADKFLSPENINTILDAPFAILFIFVIYLINPEMALIVFLLCVIYFILGIFWSFYASSNDLNINKTQSDRDDLIKNALSSKEIINIFGVGKKLLSQWKNLNDNLYKQTQLKLDRVNLIQSSIRLYSALVTIIVISWGAKLVVDGEINIGVLIGINILAARSTIPVLSFAYIFKKVKNFKADVKSLNSFLNIPNDTHGNLELKNFKGSVALSKVNYEYLGSNQLTIENLSFEISSGDVLIIKGQNGSGKTTLAKIISGINAPTSGSVLIDGINLRQIDFEWWSSQIIYMPESTSFFNGSILENFNIYQSNISIQKVRECLVSVGLGSIAEETNQGINMELHDNGNNLSIGIRRRLALARALASDGQVIIFDEPTENLDIESKQKVYALLNRFVKSNKTIICFSQDPEIVKAASYVIDLDQGGQLKKVKM
ncbi:ATP-binding cassette domain-containing protein [Alphaproteobacteria bacterium]|nr:ATP-binding cassette domain-containing protein [Alphaproteobacteria bacterium]